MFTEPSESLINEGIKVLAYPTAWTDEVPFLTALQYHSGWAMANNVTVLASGYHEPFLWCLGLRNLLTFRNCWVTLLTRTQGRLWWVLETSTRRWNLQILTHGSSSSK